MGKQYKFTVSGALLVPKLSFYPLKATSSNDKLSWKGRGDYNMSNAVIASRKNFIQEGAMYYMPITLASDGLEQIEIDEAVVSVNLSKSIIKTQIVGMNGTVKEYISSGDYDISIRTAVTAIDEAGNFIDSYPTDAVRKLKEILDVKSAIKVANDFFDMLNISSIVITGYNIDQMTDSNRQEVSIKAISDNEYTVYYEE